MRNRHALAVCGSLLIVMAPIPSGEIHAAPHSSVRNVILQVRDLPSGFKQTVSRSISNSAYARSFGIKESTARRKGRVSGYETRFGRSTAKALNYVDDEVHAFTSARGARWGYDLALTTVGGGRRVSIGRVGEQNRTYAYVSKTKRGTSITVYAMVFHRGVYFAALFAGGVTGQFKSSQVLHYARVMDLRMRQG